MSTQKANHTIWHDFFRKYFELFPHMQPIDCVVLRTDSLNKSHIDIRPDLKETLSPYLTPEEDNMNGRMVPPQNINGHFFLLLNEHRIEQYTKDNSYTWIGTFAHELTHAIDYRDMALKKNLPNCDELSSLDNYSLFIWWSEYHARKYGYTFLRHILIGNEIPVSEQKSHIISKELPAQFDRFYEAYHATQNGTAQINEVMQFLGRLSVWYELFPDLITDDVLSSIWCGTTWLPELFFLLIECDTLDNFLNRSASMQEILSTNFIL